MKSSLNAFLALLTGVFVFYISSCRKDRDPETELTCRITSPIEGTQFESGSVIMVEVDVNMGEDMVSSVEFFANGHSHGFSNSAPYRRSWSTPDSVSGDYLIEVVAYGPENEKVLDEIHVELKMKTQYIWTPISPFPGANREGSVAFSIDRKGYVGLGLDPPFLNDFYEYDALTDQWTELDTFPGGARYNAIAFAIDGYGYVGLGSTKGFDLKLFDDMWRFDPVKKSWTQLNDFPISYGVDRCEVFQFGSRVFVLVEQEVSLYEYHVGGDTWTEVANFPGFGRTGGTAFTIGSQGYYGFGFERGTIYPNDLWKYDILEDRWSAAGKHASGKGSRDGTAFVIYDQAFYGLGYYYNNPTDSFWLFSPETGKIEPVTKYPGGSDNHQVTFVIGNDAYVGLGPRRQSFYKFEVKW